MFEAALTQKEDELLWKGPAEFAGRAFPGFTIGPRKSVTATAFP